MSEPVDIRIANEKDAEAIAALNRFVQQLHTDALPDLFPPPSAAAFSAVEVAALMRQPGHSFYLAECEGRAAGYVYLNLRDLPGNALRYPLRTLNLDHICVHPDFRRRGVGEQLVETARAVARLEGVTTLELSVWAFNTAARAFFEKQGFEPFVVRMWSRGQPPPVFGSLPVGQVALARPGAYLIALDGQGRVAVVERAGGCLLPGGGIEPGELPEQALRREAREELAHELVDPRFLVEAHEYLWATEEKRWYRIEGQYYQAALGEPTGADAESDHPLRWLTIEEALSTLLRPSQSWALEQAVKRQSENLKGSENL